MDDSKYLEQKNNNKNYNNNIENGFYFMIHGYISIDEPKNKTCNNKYN